MTTTDTPTSTSESRKSTICNLLAIIGCVVGGASLYELQSVKQEMQHLQKDLEVQRRFTDTEWNNALILFTIHKDRLEALEKDKRDRSLSE